MNYYTPLIALKQIKHAFICIILAYAFEQQDNSTISQA